MDSPQTFRSYRLTKSYPKHFVAPKSCLLQKDNTMTVAFVLTDQLMIIMEHASYGNLQTYLKERSPGDEYFYLRGKSCPRDGQSQHTTCSGALSLQNCPCPDTFLSLCVCVCVCVCVCLSVCLSVCLCLRLCTFGFK